MTEKPAEALVTVADPRKAIGMSVTVMCGAGAQVVLQTHMDAEASPVEQDRAADALMRIALRQRAIAELPDLEADLRKKETTFAERQAAEEAMKPRRAAGVAERKGRVREAEQKVVSQKRAFEMNWSQRRQGPYKPSASDDATMCQLIEEVAKAEHEAEAAENEEAAAEEAFLKNTAIWLAEIDEAKKKIAEAKALIGDR